MHRDKWIKEKKWYANLRNQHCVLQSGICVFCLFFALHLTCISPCIKNQATRSSSSARFSYNITKLVVVVFQRMPLLHTGYSSSYILGGTPPTRDRESPSHRYLRLLLWNGALDCGGEGGRVWSVDTTNGKRGWRKDGTTVVERETVCVLMFSNCARIHEWKRCGVLVSWLCVHRNVLTVQNVSPAENKDHANCYCGFIF